MASVTSVVLQQNIPNPFGNNTSIGYDIPDNLHDAQLMVSDMSGKVLKQIPLQSGKGNITIDGSTLNAGAYSYSLLINGKVVASKKMIIAR
ncbi:MAG: T9SS type A sorting domain-containing protein [Bacteroidetes bacterium]|nr:T9SS type A sorting domain-containing protein [Bacteroidota bacterium]